MRYFSINYFSFFIIVFFLFITSLSFSQSLDELLNKADQLMEFKYDNQKALDTLSQANKLYPDNWKVYSRLSRVYVYLSDSMPHNTSEEKDAQLAEYQKAYDYANKAVKLAPNKSVNYLRRAIANGKIALFKGVFSVAGVVNAVRADCEKAIALGNGNNYVQGLSHYVLARTNAKISEKWAPARAILGLGWASLDTAFVQYKKAIELYPNFRMFYLDLAKAYIREDEYNKAKGMLKKTIESPKKDQNDDSLLVEAKKLLNKIKNK